MYCCSREKLHDTWVPRNFEMQTNEKRRWSFSNKEVGEIWFGSLGSLVERHIKWRATWRPARTWTNARKGLANVKERFSWNIDWRLGSMRFPKATLLMFYIGLYAPSLFLIDPRRWKLPRPFRFSTMRLRKVEDLLKDQWFVLFLLYMPIIRFSTTF